MGLYKSSITANDGTRSVEHHYGYNAEDAGQNHKANFELTTDKTVSAQKVTPAKGVDGFPDSYKG